MVYISNPHPTPEDERTAYKWSFFWLAFYFVRIFCNENVARLCNMASIRADQIVNLVVYDKMMTLSNSYRRFLKEGDFITHFNVHTKIMTNFLKSSASLFSAPTTLVLAVVFVFIQVGAYGAVLPVVVLLSLLAQIVIYQKVARLVMKKLKHYNDRLICNLEMLSSYKQLKSLGWEELLSIKNRQFRQLENKYNLKAYLFNSIYTFLVSFVPPLSILLIFVIDLAVEGHSKFATVNVFTIISFVGLISSPLNNLPSTVALLFEAIEACHRIDHLLQAEDAKAVGSLGLEKGVIVISDLIARWDSSESNRHYQ